jgi:hypothetical protein
MPLRGYCLLNTVMASREDGKFEFCMNRIGKIVIAPPAVHTQKWFPALLLGGSLPPTREFLDGGDEGRGGAG